MNKDLTSPKSPLKSSGIGSLIRRGVIGLLTIGLLISSFSSFLIAQETTFPVTEKEPIPPEDTDPAPGAIPPAVTPPTMIPVEALPLSGTEGTTPALSAEEEALPPSEATAPIPSIVHITLRPKWQVVSLSSPSYKAKEYRSLPEGLYLDLLSASFEQEHQEIRVSVHHLFLIGEEDPETHMSDSLGNSEIGYLSGPLPARGPGDMKDSFGSLEWRRYGLTDLRIDYQERPHLYADSLSGSLESLSAPRDLNRLNFRITPGDQLSLQVNLAVEERKGTRPFSTENVTSLDVNNKVATTAVVEVAEPIDYTTTSLSFGAEYLNGPLVIQFENQFQFFNNNRPTSFSWDDIQRTPACQGNPSDPLCSVDGAAKISDDYWVHTLTLRPSLRLSDHWNWMNSLSYSEVSSRIKLIPFSTSSSIGDSLPSSSVEPDVRNLAFFSALAGQPWKDVTLKFRYRFKDYQNDTFIPSPFPAYVKLEEEIRYPRTPFYISHREQSLETEGIYRLARWGSILGGFHLEQDNRNQREVSEFRENRYFVKARASFHRLQGESGYTVAQGTQSGYNAAWYQTVYDPDVNNAETQHTLLRAVDLADYTSHEFHAGMTYQPIDSVTTGLNYKNRHKEYPDTQVGRTASEDHILNADLQYAPWETVTSFAQYIYQKSDISGSYTWSFETTLPSPAQDSTYIDFRILQNEVLSDQTDTVVVGIQYDPVSDFQITGSYSLAQSTNTATQFPTVTSRFEDFSLEIRYRFNRFPISAMKDFSIGFSYQYERFEQDDFALANFPGPGDTSNPSSPDDLFLGIRDPNYTAHVMSASCTFSF